MAFVPNGPIIDNTDNGSGFFGTIWNSGLANVITFVEFDVGNIAGNTSLGSSLWSLFNNTGISLAVWTDDDPLTPSQLGNVGFLPFDSLSLLHGTNIFSWNVSSLINGGSQYLGFAFFQEDPNCRPAWLTGSWLSNEPANPVPEPGTIFLLASGLPALYFASRRTGKQKALSPETMPGSA